MEGFSSVKYFVGTIAIPNTFPELATIEFHEKVTLSGGTLDDVVQITERKPLWTIVRTVSVRDVVGVFMTTETNPDEIRRQWLDDQNWKTGERAIRGIEGPKRGIACILEQASVIMTVEFGMPAPDSAEYDAPIRYSPQTRLMMNACQCRDPCC